MSEKASVKTDPVLKPLTQLLLNLDGRNSRQWLVRLKAVLASPIPFPVPDDGQLTGIEKLIIDGGFIVTDSDIQNKNAPHCPPSRQSPLKYLKHGQWFHKGDCLIDFYERNCLPATTYEMLEDIVKNPELVVEGHPIISISGYWSFDDDYYMLVISRKGDDLWINLRGCECDVPDNYLVAVVT